MAAHNVSTTVRSLYRSNDDQKNLTRFFIVLALCWTLFIAGLSFWEDRQTHAIALELARTDALSSFNKDLVFRRWATRHGGVYVPISVATPVNPYLAHVPERDIKTPSGKKLTLMNPAYMARQVHELAKEQYGVQGHITSLNVIRPENAPDAWERSALQAFEAGSKEASSLEMIGNEQYMRLMRPMITEAGCLKCHAQQGYKVGDIRGGISVSVPWKQYHEVTRGELYAVYWGYSIVWVIGIAGLWFTQSRLQHSLLMRRQVEDALAERNQFIESIINLSPDMLYIYDLIARKNIYINEGIQKILGYSAEEVKDMGDHLIGTLMHPDDLDRYVKEIWPRYRQAQANELIHHQYRMKHKKGQWYWLDCSELIYTREPDGTPRQILGVVHDITEQKYAEKTLIETDVKFKEAQRLAHIGSWDWNATTDTISWSPEYYNIYNLDPKAPTPNYQEHLKVYTPESIEKLDAAVKKAMETGEPYELDLELANPDAERRWIVARGEVLRNADGSIIGLRGTAQNITERKLSEEQIYRSLREKEVMLQEIHHRVKNNMQVIYSLLNLQAKSVDDAQVRAMFEESRNRVSSMALIHERLYRSKDLAHIEFKEYLANLISGIADTYKRRDVVFDVDMDPFPLDVNVGIPCGLIMNELVSNCLKHAFPGERKGMIKLGINRNSEGSYVLFVADNGIGFPASLDFRSTTSLGLQLVNVLTNQIKGTIELSNGEGTRFSITFPGSTV